jgi:hypothetical protein
MPSILANQQGDQSSDRLTRLSSPNPCNRPLLRLGPMYVCHERDELSKGAYELHGGMDELLGLVIKQIISRRLVRSHLPAVKLVACLPEKTPI